MRWHMWVVLIAGSTGSALRAVRLSNFHIPPVTSGISFTPRVRRVRKSGRVDCHPPGCLPKALTLPWSSSAAEWNSC